MRRGSGSGGGGGCSSPRGSENAGRGNGYQGFVNIRRLQRRLQPCERNIDIETSDIMVVPEASRDFGSGGGRRVRSDGEFEQESHDTAGLGSGKASGELVDIVESEFC